jgi:hypothetical protein
MQRRDPCWKAFRTRSTFEYYDFIPQSDSSLRGCNTQMQNCRRVQHEANCDHRLIQCEICECMVKFNALAAHMDTCPKQLVPCPNNGCDEIVTNDQISAYRSV